MLFILYVHYKNSTQKLQIRYFTALIVWDIVVHLFLLVDHYFSQKIKTDVDDVQVDFLIISIIDIAGWKAPWAPTSTVAQPFDTIWMTLDKNWGTMIEWKKEKIVT